MNKLFSVLSKVLNVGDPLDNRYYADNWGMAFPTPTSSGQRVNDEQAMREATVYACVRVISESVAQLPIYLMRKKGDKRVKDENRSLYRLLLYSPGNYMSAFDFWKWNMMCLYLRGFYIAKINRRSSDKEPIGLVPCHPNYTRWGLNADGTLYAETVKCTDVALGRVSDSYRITLQEKDMLYSFYASMDGVQPISPIKYNAETIGFAREMREHGSTLFKNSALPAGVLTVAKKLDQPARKRLRQGWFRRNSGGNRGKVAIIEEGMKYDKVSMTNEDAQYLESRQYTKEEICGIFGVPTHMISDTKQAKGWSTIEQSNLAFLTLTLAPVLRRTEDSIRMSLIPQSEWSRSYANFDEKVLLRADMKTRSETHERYYDMNVMNPNEIREDLEYNPYEGGDAYQYELLPAQEDSEDEEETNEDEE